MYENLSLVGKRVEVISTRERGYCTDFGQALDGDDFVSVYWVVIRGEPHGYRPSELREIGWFRRLVRKLMGKDPLISRCLHMNRVSDGFGDVRCSDCWEEV